MDRKGMRTRLRTDGRLEIRRSRVVCLAWILLYVLLGAMGGAFVVLGAADPDAPLLFVPLGVVLLALMAVGLWIFGPGLTGGVSLVIDEQGVWLEDDLAPWSRITEVETVLGGAPGESSAFVKLRGPDGRSPFSRHPSPWFAPRGGRMLRPGLVVSQSDLADVVREEHLKRTLPGARPDEGGNGRRPASRLP